MFIATSHTVFFYHGPTTLLGQGLLMIVSSHYTQTHHTR